MASPELMRKGPADQLWDSIFENELNLAVDMTYEAYSKCVSPSPRAAANEEAQVALQGGAKARFLHPTRCA